MKIGYRKFYAFLISVCIYVGLFLIAVLSGVVQSDDISSFAFQLGVGLMTVSSPFFAGNVLTHKYRSGDTNEPK